MGRSCYSASALLFTPFILKFRASDYSPPLSLQDYSTICLTELQPYIIN